MDEQLLALLARFQERLPAKDIDYLRELATHSEWGIGLQDLCTQLFEHSVPIEPSELETIKALSSAMGLPRATWRFLDPGTAATGLSDA
jgi:hypothetical protein